MTQTGMRTWLVRAVKEAQTKYYLANSTDRNDAKRRVENMLKGQGWQIDDAVEPQQL